VTIILVSELLLTGRDLGNSLATTGPGYRYHPREDSEQIAIAKELSSGFRLTWSHGFRIPRRAELHLHKDMLHKDMDLPKYRQAGRSRWKSKDMSPPRASCDAVF
jgi:hypothetical protein